MPFLDSSVAHSDRFTDIRLLGHGACGQVYYALDTRLNVPVAIKEVLPADQDFQKTLDKFRRESQIQARLRHTNIISVYDLKEDSRTGEYYLVCEYANAGTLAEHLQRHGPLPEPTAIGIVLDICAALEKIWSERIVHCDIKPANILLAQDAQGAITAKLGDFGIAKGELWRETTMLPGAHHPGTPLYMAPEQWDLANRLDVRTDIYALGITLFEIVTGQDYKSLLAQAALPDVRQYNSHASAAIAHVIRKAVQEDRMERYQKPQEMADDLKRALRGDQPRFEQAPASSQQPVSAPSATSRRGIKPGLLVLAGIIAFGILGVQLALALPGQACAPGQILFVSNRDGDNEVYVMEPNGSAQRQLTVNTDEDNLPRWSPDHSRIVFVSYRDGQPDLYIMDADGQNQKRLTKDTGDDPVWSPDGKRIAFASQRAFPSRRNEDWEIYVMNADGTNPKRLTFNRVSNTRPSWSPDGSKIVYTSKDSSGAWDLHVIDGDGNNNTVIVANGSRNNRPVWSPDGKHIAYATNLHGNWDIYVANVDGSDQKRLTDDNADEGDVAWSPDSRCLAFTRGPTGDREIYTMDVEGNKLQNRTRDTRDDTYPSWAP